MLTGCSRTTLQIHLWRQGIVEESGKGTLWIDCRSGAGQPEAQRPGAGKGRGGVCECRLCQVGTRTISLSMVSNIKASSIFPSDELTGPIVSYENRLNVAEQEAHSCGLGESSVEGWGEKFSVRASSNWSWHCLSSCVRSSNNPLNFGAPAIGMLQLGRPHCVACLLISLAVGDITTRQI